MELNWFIKTNEKILKSRREKILKTIMVSEEKIPDNEHKWTRNQERREETQGNDIIRKQSNKECNERLGPIWRAKKKWLQKYQESKEMSVLDKNYSSK